MGRSAAWRPSIGQRQVTVTDRSKQSVISFAQFAHIAEYLVVRGDVCD
jgi:hypothetical protein